MKKEKIHIFLASGFILLFLLSIVGCGIFSSRDENQQYEHKQALWASLPGWVHVTYDSVMLGNFRHFDSLVHCLDRYEELKGFKASLYRKLHEKNYTSDFARAYDGDSLASQRLFLGIDTSQKEELDLLIQGLSNFDPLTLLERLKIRSRTEQDSDTRDKLLGMIEWLQCRDKKFDIENTYLNIRKPTYPSFRFSDTQIESALTQGLNVDFAQTNIWGRIDVLEEAMRRGNRGWYCRALQIGLDMVEIGTSSFSMHRNLPIDKLVMIPFNSESPHDTQSVIEVFDALMNKRLYETSAKGGYFNAIPETLTISKELIILIDSAMFFLADKLSDKYKVLTSGRAIQSYANWHGNVNYVAVSIQINDEFSAIILKYATAQPILRGGGSGGLQWGKFLLRKVNGTWKLLGYIDWVIS